MQELGHKHFLSVPMEMDREQRAFADRFLLGEPDEFFATMHVCDGICSHSSCPADDLGSVYEVDFPSFWAEMENYGLRKNKEGEGECCGEKALIKLEPGSAEKGLELRGRRPGRGGGSPGKKELTFEQVSRHFSMPIRQAAQKLGVGLTLLKLQCRRLGIPRWPHRKLKSLQTLVNNVEELSGEQHGPEVRRVVKSLLQERKMIEKMPGMKLKDGTKVIRQAYFKENFKRRRLMAHGGC
ncbi:hypothetical protein ACP4OV_000943 [Aristida adscensionis]